MRQAFSNWSETLKSRFKAWVSGRSKDLKSVAPERQRRTLVKSRPLSLEQRYELLDHEELGDEVFLRLKDKIFAAAKSRRPFMSPGFLTEAGRVAPGRPYFFVKPMNGRGWLFERSGKGWVVTSAEKIVGRDLFLRSETPVDVVSLYLARDRAVFPRVKSNVFGSDLLSFSVYEQRLMNQIGCGT